jgi:peptidoglycan/LPS O-acetylase OafA/YrhL
VYLVHAFAPIALGALLAPLGVYDADTWPDAPRALAAWVTSLALAGALWVAVERPAHRWKDRLRDA